MFGQNNDFNGLLKMYGDGLARMEQDYKRLAEMGQQYNNMQNMVNNYQNNPIGTVPQQVPQQTTPQQNVVPIDAQMLGVLGEIRTEMQKINKSLFKFQSYFNEEDEEEEEIVKPKRKRRKKHDIPEMIEE
jgi:hypothetical protein